jgi:serine/threonine-protein kinase ULK4
MIHCDIKPRNFLVDEYGILKLSDFKLIQRIPEAPIGDMPLASRGSPSHMAPELFTSEGVHSFQSDFWAVGCMLYELRRGSAPFGGEDATIGQLVERIRTMEPVSSPLLAPRSKEGDKRNANIPSLSAELADLLRWLLEKAPMNRCNWWRYSVKFFINCLTLHLLGRRSPVTPTGAPTSPRRH